MKKFILAAVMFVGAAAQANAQSFTTTSDTAKGAISTYLDIHNNITNISSAPIQITWKITDSDFPAAWKAENVLGICDNALCRTNANDQLFTKSFTSANYDPNVEGDFHVQLTNFDNSGIGSGSHYIKMELREGLNAKNVTFLVTKYPTGVTSVTKANDKILMYPNPARGELNVVFDKEMGVTGIGVYNLIGKAVTYYKVAGNSAKLNLDNTPSGIYFIRMTDNQGNVLATRKFIHE